MGVEKLRQGQEMEVFWAEFGGFCQANQELVSHVIDQIGCFAHEDGSDLTASEVLTAAEAHILTCYGVFLAAVEGRGWLKAAGLPSMRIVGPDAGHKRVMLWVDEENTELKRRGLPFKTVILVNVGSLLEPGKNVSPLLEYWQEKEAETKTVSKFLPDWAVIDLVLGGAEEYAHHLFRKIKSYEANERVDEDRRPKDNEFGRLSAQGDYDQGFEIYHTANVEYRGLIWRMKILERYFPSYAQPAREFKQKVEARMYG